MPPERFVDIKYHIAPKKAVASVIGSRIIAKATRITFIAVLFNLGFSLLLIAS
jgi:hypothetical protein